MKISSPIARTVVAGIAGVAVAVIAAAPAAASSDRNHDRIPDRWETHHGLSLNVSQARKDQDRDGLANRGEWRAKFDPMNDDTDGDGVEDGDEGAGTVTSFDSTSGELVINLFSGQSVTGTVDADTEIECENDDADQPDDNGDDGPNHDINDDHGDDGPGHDGSDDSGDDNGDDSSGPGHDRLSGDDEGDANCSTADLVPGAVIREAELDATASGLVFEEIELG